MWLEEYVKVLRREVTSLVILTQSFHFSEPCRLQNILSILLLMIFVVISTGGRYFCLTKMVFPSFLPRLSSPIRRFLLPMLSLLVAVLCVLESAFTKSFQSSLSLRSSTSMNQKCSQLSLPSSCGLPCCKVFKLNCFTYISVISSQPAANRFMQCYLHELWLLLPLYNIHLVVRSVSGSENWLADALSRFHTGNCCDQVHLFAADYSMLECSVPDGLFFLMID